MSFMSGEEAMCCLKTLCVSVHVCMCACAHRKQCIELEQQFDFLKDLVAAVPDMQGEGEENHAEGGGEKVPRRYLTGSHTLTHTPLLVCLYSTMTTNE